MAQVMAKISYSDDIEYGKNELRLRIKELIREYNHIVERMMLNNENYASAYEEVIGDLTSILEKD